MLLLTAAVLSLLIGATVAFWGQDRRVKVWFLVVCMGAAAIAFGLHVETTMREYAYLAARANMSAALFATCAAFLSARAMCSLPLHWPAILLIAFATVVNLITVWVTDWYFTGGFNEYSWGFYVAGRKEFIINPLLVIIIGLYALINLATNFQRAHPLDRNRTGFLFLAYFFLSLGVLDYLPHFNIDPFGGPVSGITIPLFLMTFGYAILRYRLIEFRVFLGRGAGFLLTGLLMAIAFTLYQDAAHRLNLDTTRFGLGLTVLMVGIYALVGMRLPVILEKAIRRREPDYQLVIAQFSNELTALWDEESLIQKTSSVCTQEFNSPQVRLVEGGPLWEQAPLGHAIRQQHIVEAEILRRSYDLANLLLPEDEIIVPLTQGENMNGALILGRRADGKMYTRIALQSLRMLGNIFSLALANVRSAKELHRRHELDRFLAPQVVERVLQGDTESINKKQRLIVTIFFSDLKGFTEMADLLDPDDLAVVLNEYLSEMAEIAFQYGGTVDKFIGDAVMIFFGAPVSGNTPEQARQCVRMAITMQQRLSELNRSWISRGLLKMDLACRIGIHTGEATVGSFGSHSRVDYTAIGNAVNLASRLEGQCTEGKILVSEQTGRLVRDALPVEYRGSLEIKGFHHPVTVYEINPEIRSG